MTVPVSITHYTPEVHTSGLKSTPVALFEQLYSTDSCGFIYESLNSDGSRGRYSFTGGKPCLIFQAHDQQCGISFENRHLTVTGCPLAILEELTAQVQTAPDVQPYAGGPLGYLAYDAIRYIEKLPGRHPASPGEPDLFFLFPGEIIVFDYHLKQMTVIVYACSGHQEKIAALLAHIAAAPRSSGPPQKMRLTADDLRFSPDKASFCAGVDTIKRYIRDGHIFQTVFSRRVTFPVTSDPLDVFKQLRLTNPSPYMYFLKLAGTTVLGSSPEILVKNTGGTALSRPLAGTRPRGGTPAEDTNQEQDLLSDEKETAEHIMLVDLARNDLGRVCRPGSIETTGLMDIERCAEVMHIVSTVRGRLLPGKNSFDLIKACFPAGTVSGAPKIRAMEIIDELEPQRRWVYAGGIGYFCFNGDMDMCITIRTIVIKNGTGFIQAGAGIVADSIPEKEYAETLSKAGALLRAIGLKDQT